MAKHPESFLDIQYDDNKYKFSKTYPTVDGDETETLFQAIPGFAEYGIRVGSDVPMVLCADCHAALIVRSQAELDAFRGTHDGHWVMVGYFNTESGGSGGSTPGGGGGIHKL